jgi:hypothetical protein
MAVVNEDTSDPGKYDTSGPVNDDTSAAARTGHGIRQDVGVTIR